MSYISSNDNRLYAALEAEYGSIAAVTEQCRIPAIRLAVAQRSELKRRRDKTGSRTFTGVPTGARRKTSYVLDTYLGTWTAEGEPGYGALFKAGLGGSAVLSAGGTVASCSGTRVRLQAAHGLTAGQALAVGSEVRFVSAVVDTTTLEVNAPFSPAVAVTGAEATPSVTYRLGSCLPSVSLFDYWSPGTALQRVIRGAAVDTLTIRVNSDFHEFQFAGPACDVADNRTFVDGEGDVVEFPEEPPSRRYDYGVVPGHMGQVWLGATPERFYTLMAAEITLRNNIESDVREFGAHTLRRVVAGERDVTADFEVYAADDEQTIGLYEASRHRSPISAMFQLGEQAGQMCGIFMKNLVVEPPSVDDSENRVAWKFSACRAQGAGEDEIVVAFA